MKNRVLSLCLGGILTVFGASAQAANSSPASKADIVELAEADGRFTTLVTAVKAAGLEAYLSQTQDLTVFAPTDAAFAKLPAGTLEALLADKAALKNLLTYHVVGAKVPASVAVTLREATMLNGEKVMLRFDGTSLFVNDAQVIIKDIMAENGIVHAIDTVLVP
jgi:uncharacterized surface protein with fasciclin (FAS1) repeats